MIIVCVNCNKKFEVDSSLIPQSGRNLQCGLCDHKWFYKNSENFDDNEIIERDNQNFISNPTQSEIFEKKDEPKLKQKIKSKKAQKVEDDKKGLSISKILSYILVLIISFIGIIIVLDTFKSPLEKFFPNLELRLFNLFETIKDIFLFIKDIFS
tara:strand:+ start:114 stop:575 length:462 start_codon:yes stop_codon:yes gene_type:complete